MALTAAGALRAFSTRVGRGEGGGSLAGGGQLGRGGKEHVVGPRVAKGVGKGQLGGGGGAAWPRGHGARGCAEGRKGGREGGEGHGCRYVSLPSGHRGGTRDGVRERVNKNRLVDVLVT